MEHIGMDVHKKESQICILTEEGELIERRIHTAPQRFGAVLGDRSRARILIEAHLLSRVLQVSVIRDVVALKVEWVEWPLRSMATSSDIPAGRMFLIAVRRSA